MGAAAADRWIRRLPASRRPGRLGLLLRVALLPAAVAALLGLLFAMGSAELKTQQDTMQAVVETDLERSARLADINSRLQAANADMYRLITQAAAGDKSVDYPARIKDLSRLVDGTIADLKTYRDQEPAGPQRDMLDKFIDDIGLYKGAIDWLGSMLEIDFKTAFAFVAPYNSHVDRMSQQLSTIISGSTATAKRRADVAAEALRRAAYYYVIAAVAVSILVLAFAYFMVMRQERLTVAAEVKTRQVATLLDNSGQGFLSFGPDLLVAAEYSRACEEFLGRVPAGLPADGLLFPGDGEARQLMRSVVARVEAEADPDKRAVYLSLLPGEVALGERVLAAEYKAVCGGIMLVLTDVTEARTLARQVERERKRLEMIVAAVSDGRDVFDAVEGFRRFIAGEMDGQVAAGTPAAAILADAYRQVHTFKGAFDQFSFHYLPAALHELEGRLQDLRDGDAPPSLETVRRVVAEANCIGWLEIDLATIRDVLGDRFVEDGGIVRLTIAEFRRLDRLARRLAADTPEARELLERLAALRKVPLRRALGEFDHLVQRIAERCGKAVAPLAVDGDDVLVDPDLFHPFLRALGHVFRNAVGHGIEDPETRLAAGKDHMGHIRATVADRGGTIRVEIADDGAGLDLAGLRRRASAQGGEAAAALSDAEVADLVFSDGTSTSDELSLLSGRGMGLGAVRAAVEALGGTVAVASEPGRGTRFTFDLPQPTTLSAEAA